MTAHLEEHLSAQQEKMIILRGLLVVLEAAIAQRRMELAGRLIPDAISIAKEVDTGIDSATLCRVSGASDSG